MNTNVCATALAVVAALSAPRFAHAQGALGEDPKTQLQVDIERAQSSLATAIAVLDEKWSLEDTDARISELMRIRSEVAANTPWRDRVSTPEARSALLDALTDLRMDLAASNPVPSERRRREAQLDDLIWLADGYGAEADARSIHSDAPGLIDNVLAVIAPSMEHTALKAIDSIGERWAKDVHENREGSSRRAGMLFNLTTVVWSLAHPKPPFQTKFFAPDLEREHASADRDLQVVDTTIAELEREGGHADEVAALTPLRDTLRARVADLATQLALASSTPGQPPSKTAGFTKKLGEAATPGK